MKNVLIVFFYQTFVRFSSGSILDWHFSLHQETQLDENKIFDFLTRTQSERNKITQLSTFVVWLFLLQPFRHVRLFINKSTFHLRLFCISDIVSCNFFHEGVIFCVTFCFFCSTRSRRLYSFVSCKKWEPTKNISNECFSDGATQLLCRQIAVVQCYDAKCMQIEWNIFHNTYTCILEWFFFARQSTFDSRTRE